MTSPDAMPPLGQSNAAADRREHWRTARRRGFKLIRAIAAELSKMPQGEMPGGPHWASQSATKFREFYERLRAEYPATQIVASYTRQ